MSAVAALPLVLLLVSLALVSLLAKASSALLVVLRAAERQASVVASAVGVLVLPPSRSLAVQPAAAAEPVAERR